MWSTEATHVTDAGPAAIWARWVDPEHWPEQDAGMEWARLDGPLAVGTRILMKPHKSPRTSCTITELVPLEAFRTEARLPLAKLRVDHEMSTKSDSTEFRHRITMTGPLAGLFWRLFGKELASSLPTMLANIARLAEQADAR